MRPSRQAQIKIGGLPTKVSFTPTFLSKGENGTRYAIVLHTAGNHFVALVEGNKFAQGTLFYSTDAGFYAGDLTKDLAFELLFARFNSSRTEVQLQPLTLSGGIASIDVLAEAIVPAGSQLVYEIQIAGKWYSMSDPASPLPLNSLPPLLPWRAVLLGTTESMPGFGVSSNSRAYTSRPRSDFRHVSTARTVPSTTSIDIDFRLDRWRGPPYHTFTPRLMTGAGYTTLTAPSLVQELDCDGRSERHHPVVPLDGRGDDDVQDPDGGHDRQRVGVLCSHPPHRCGGLRWHRNQRLRDDGPGVGGVTEGT